MTILYNSVEKKTAAITGGCKSKEKNISSKTGTLRTSDSTYSPESFVFFIVPSPTRSAWQVAQVGKGFLFIIYSIYNILVWDC